MAEQAQNSKTNVKYPHSCMRQKVISHHERVERFGTCEVAVGASSHCHRNADL
jgi:hypothetical protein